MRIVQRSLGETRGPDIIIESFGIGVEREGVGSLTRGVGFGLATFFGLGAGWLVVE